MNDNPIWVSNGTTCSVEKGHSTCTALVGGRHDKLLHRKKGEVTLGTRWFLERSSTICNKMLITKMFSLGSSKTFLTKQSSFLINSSLYIQVDGKVSNMANL